MGRTFQNHQDVGSLETKGSVAISSQPPLLGMMEWGAPTSQLLRGQKAQGQGYFLGDRVPLGV